MCSTRNVLNFKCKTTNINSALKISVHATIWTQKRSCDGCCGEVCHSKYVDIALDEEDDVTHERRTDI
jgi:hypothetical protein